MFQQPSEQYRSQPDRAVFRAHHEIDGIGALDVLSKGRETHKWHEAELGDDLLLLLHHPQRVAAGSVGRVIEKLPAQESRREHDIVRIAVARHDEVVPARLVYRGIKSNYVHIGKV